MKIAIQGHPTRGKEVIQILESLGGINDGLHEGNNPDCYYELHGNIIWCVSTKGINFKYYTLEEFEKEFPFKIGDKVFLGKNNEHLYTIKSIKIWFDGNIAYEFAENGLHYAANKLTLYKKMKEERNITLTLDKAQEWYKKGGELKEIALQAFTENELNPQLPRSWEEFCKQSNPIASWRYDIPIKHEALFKLEQLRDCWRQGWNPNWNDEKEYKYCISNYQGKFKISILCETRYFLSFPTYEMAEEFLKCFRDLIEKAGDLI